MTFLIASPGRSELLLPRLVIAALLVVFGALTGRALARPSRRVPLAARHLDQLLGDLAGGHQAPGAECRPQWSARLHVDSGQCRARPLPVPTRASMRGARQRVASSPPTGARSRRRRPVRCDPDHRRRRGLRRRVPDPAQPRAHRGAAGPILTSLTSWDGWYYLGIARDGYQADPSSGAYTNVVYPPVYPLLVRLLSLPIPGLPGAGRGAAVERRVPRCPRPAVPPGHAVSRAPQGGDGGRPAGDLPLRVRLRDGLHGEPVPVRDGRRIPGRRAAPPGVGGYLPRPGNGDAAAGRRC